MSIIDHVFKCALPKFVQMFEPDMRHKSNDIESM